MPTYVLVFGDLLEIWRPVWAPFESELVISCVIERKYIPIILVFFCMNFFLVSSSFRFSWLFQRNLYVVLASEKGSTNSIHWDLFMTKTLKFSRGFALQFPKRALPWTNCEAHSTPQIQAPFYALYDTQIGLQSN